jgi:hypothetical protein
MLRLLERNIIAIHERLVVLAPPQRTLPKQFTNLRPASDERQDYIDELQRLRGGIYFADGAISTTQMSVDGRHQTPEDDKSWHLLLLDEQREVSGCIWYMEHDGMPSTEELRASRCPLALQAGWGDSLRGAIEADVANARRERVRYAEVGGWAVAPSSRPADCLLLILGTYSLSQLLGGAFVMATATVRHSSAPILRRMGGSSYQHNGRTLPSYYDPRFQSDMELLRFDTRRPAVRFAPLVKSFREQLAAVPVWATQVAGGAATYPRMPSVGHSWPQPCAAQIGD